MRNLRSIPAFFIALFLFSCSGSKMEDKSMEPGLGGLEQNYKSPPSGKLSNSQAAGNASIESDGREGKEEDNTTPINDPIAIIERKLIKNGEVNFKTKNLSETKKNIEQTLKSLKGYIAKENAYDYSENPQEELIVRVPAQNFDELLNAILKGADQVDSKKIDIEDVTEQFVDIESRLKNKKQLEGKYQELLAKANKMEDILLITAEMNQIREDIDATEGRLKYLSNQVNYSTLRITYYQHKPSGFNFGGKIGDAFGNGGTGFLWFLILIVQLWPLWLVGGLVWWVIVWLLRRRKQFKV